MTSGPSDDVTGRSTVTGKASHITAASRGGPRYDDTLTDKERAHPNNGIWLCAICADRVDKPENEAAFPVELLRWWKEFHESSTGTDHASLENRRIYPIRRLTIVDFAGVRGEATIGFGALTLILGTNMLNQSIGDLLLVFADREMFERTRQSISGKAQLYDRIPLPDGREWVITVKVDPPRTFRPKGRLRLQKADGRELVITTETTGATLAIGDNVVPTFRPAITAISTGKAASVLLSGGNCDQHHTLDDNPSGRFGMSLREWKACIQGTPTSESAFHYDYIFDGDKGLQVSLDPATEHLPFGVLSHGEKSRVIVDLAVRVATNAAKVDSCILLINQADLLIYPDSWSTFFEWIERKRPPFQTIVDLWERPSKGMLSRALCYEANGTDMNISSFGIKTWKSFLS